MNAQAKETESFSQFKQLKEMKLDLSITEVCFQ